MSQAQCRRGVCQRRSDQTLPRRRRCAREDLAMLFMVIERFKNKDPKPIGARFKRLGRMLPDGVTFHASWIDPVGGRCFKPRATDGIEELNRGAAGWAASPISKSCRC